MRPLDVLLLVVSAIIVIIVGFLPLITAGEDPDARIRRECQFFYESAGPEAVRQCRVEMEARGALSRGLNTRPELRTADGANCIP